MNDLIDKENKHNYKHNKRNRWIDTQRNNSYLDSMIKHNSMSASNAKSAEPATTSDGCEAITNVIDSSNANETLSTIKTEIKHKNNTASLKTKLEYIAAPRLMGVCLC